MISNLDQPVDQKKFEKEYDRIFKLEFQKKVLFCLDSYTNNVRRHVIGLIKALEAIDNRR
jgi:hypothetical protein